MVAVTGLGEILYRLRLFCWPESTSEAFLFVSLDLDFIQYLSLRFAGGPLLSCRSLFAEAY